MPSFNTKNFNAAKTAKIRAALGRKLGHPGVDATDIEINDYLTDQCRAVVQTYDELDYAAAKPAPDPL